ncbi:hypothetical protein DVH24_017661 [Malus domestica]|uniref:40S ribosomal protein S29 n=1 Tax=Malus domestica TaxID=3750 RepID=A0A498KBS2_MALDO|nr:hypothetical protein DVH24_017661 [Malus domestica]
MFHSLPLSLVPCLSRASSLSRSVSLVPCLFSSSVTLTHRRRDPFPLSLFSVLWSLDPISFLPNSAALPLRLLPSQRPTSCVCGNPHGLIRKYGLMCCRQCFRSNAKEIGFIKESMIWPKMSTSSSGKKKKKTEKKPKPNRKNRTEKKTEPKKTEKKLGRTEPNRNFGLVSVLAKNRTETNRIQPYKSLVNSN